jgi:hypothetical protein
MTGLSSFNVHLIVSLKGVIRLQVDLALVFRPAKDQDAAGDTVTAIPLLIEMVGENMSHFFTERLQELHQQSCKNLEKLWRRKGIEGGRPFVTKRHSRLIPSDLTFGENWGNVAKCWG